MTVLLLMISLPQRVISYKTFDDSTYQAIQQRYLIRRLTQSHLVRAFGCEIAHNRTTRCFDVEPFYPVKYTYTINIYTYIYIQNTTIEIGRPNKTYPKVVMHQPCTFPTVERLEASIRGLILCDPSISQTVRGAKLT